MASKSAYHESEKGLEIEEALDALETLVERLRATYEQYFLGILKIAPSQLHTDAERRLRDLSQLQIKNTALRYRFATLGQKFGAYNTYWKRTLRLIEQGKYVRDLQRVKRQAEKTGEAIPEEILAAMPKLMRDRVQRDRAAAMSIGERRVEAQEEKAAKTKGNIHRLDDALVPDDVDVDDLFAALTREAEAALDEAPPLISSRPPKRDTAQPPPLQPATGGTPKSPGIRAATPPPVMPSRQATTVLPGAPPMPTKQPPPLEPPPEGVPRTPPPRQATTVLPGGAAPPSARAPTPPPAGARPGTPPPVAPPRQATTVLPGGAAPPIAASRPGTPPPRMQTQYAPGAPPPARAVPRAMTEGGSQLGPPPGMDEEQTKALYQRYLKARQLCGESNDGVTYDKLLRTLRSQSSKIITDTKARGVEFGVVIKDNKVVLKAKPKL